MKILIAFLCLINAAIAADKIPITIYLCEQIPHELSIKKALTVDWKTRVNPDVYAGKDGKELSDLQIAYCESLNAHRDRINDFFEIKFVEATVFTIQIKRQYYALPNSEEDKFMAMEWYELFDYLIDVELYDDRHTVWRLKCLEIQQKYWISYLEHQNKFLQEHIDKKVGWILSKNGLFRQTEKGDHEYITLEQLNYIKPPEPMLPAPPAIPKYRFNNFKIYTEKQKFDRRPS